MNWMKWMLRKINDRDVVQWLSTFALMATDFMYIT